MSARDPESLMYQIISLIDEIDRVTLKLNQLDYVFGPITLEKPKFSPAELGFIRLVSWLYVLYYDVGKVNVKFLVNRFSVYNLDIDDKLNNHLLNIKQLRTYLQHNLDPNVQHNLIIKDACEKWFRDQCGTPIPVEDQHWNICLIALLNENLKFLSALRNSIRSIEKDESKEQILTDWNFLRKRNHLPHEFDTLISKVAGDMGREKLDPIRLRKRYYEKWIKELQLLQGNYNFEDEARKLIENVLLFEMTSILPITGKDIMDEFNILPGPKVGHLLKVAYDIYSSEPCSHDKLLNELKQDIATKNNNLKGDIHEIAPLQTMPTIGIITALPEEYTAMKLLLENRIPHNIPRRGAGRRFCIGNIPSVNGGEHRLVLLLADQGNNIASTRATLLLEHFPNVNSIIMVGIAGGIPNHEDHIRLGDIVVSDNRGVVQFGFTKERIKEEKIEIEHRNPPRPPSASLLESVKYLEAFEIEGNRPWIKHINSVLSRLKQTRPPVENDDLYYSIYLKEIKHPIDKKRKNNNPRIFLGPIASDNTLLRNPIKRDELRDKFGVKAIEMEGSGIADATWNHEIGYLVVRGISDYCDPNKEDGWKQYAAIVAAAYTRSLIESIPCDPYSNSS